MTDTMVEPLSLVGRVVFDPDGEEIGPVAGVYLGRDDGQPEWAAVKRPGAKFAVVPLDGAVIYEDSIEIPFTFSQVDASPVARMSRLAPQLSEKVEAELYRHYGRRSHDPVAATPMEHPSENGGLTAEGRTASGQNSQVASKAADEASKVASKAAGEATKVASTAKQQGQELVATTKERGQEVAQTAAEQAGDVADTAKRQAAEVAAEASEQARSLIEEARTQLEGQAEAQTARLAETLRQLGQQAEALAEGRPQDAPTVERYVSQAAEQLNSLADRLGGLRQEIAANGLGVVVDDVQAFARRRPAAFLVGAMLAGFGAVRLLQGNGDGSAPPDLASGPPMNPARGAEPS